MRSWRKNPKDDTKGDLYEYLLNKISQSGINGQFRTPRHIIKNVCPGRTKKYDREIRTAMGHLQTVQYIASIRP